MQNKLNTVGLFGFLLSGRKRVNAHQMPEEPLCCSVEHQQQLEEPPEGAPLGRDPKMGRSQVENQATYQELRKKSQ